MFAKCAGRGRARIGARMYVAPNEPLPTSSEALAPDKVNTYVHPVTSAEFKRWLERQGASFEPAKGGHMWIMLRGRRAILPMHGTRKEMKRGTVAAIKKQLGLE
jgi:mRNA interferase HicA